MMTAPSEHSRGWRALGAIPDKGYYWQRIAHFSNLPTPTHSGSNEKGPLMPCKSLLSARDIWVWRMRRA